MRVCHLVQSVVLFSIIGANSTISVQPKGNELVAETIAQVNGDVITRSEYEQGRQLLEKRLRRSFAGPELQKAVAQEERELLRTMIDDRLLLQKAKTLNIWPDNEAIKYLDSVRQQYKLPSMEALDEWIARE